MARTSWTLLLCGVAIFLPRASANFGFTSPGFEYVQLSTPVQLAWNGQSGQVSLRAMLYPPDDVESYIPIAANLTGTSYTWIPAALTTGSKWTLEALDSSGQVTSGQNSFTVQGGSADSNANMASSSLMQQNPKSAVQSTTLATSASATPTAQITVTASPSPTTSNPPMPSPKGENVIPMHVRVAIWLGAVLGVAVIVTVGACLFFRYRWANGKAKWRPFNKKRSTIVCEIDGNESKISIDKPVMELHGSDVPGSVDTSMGKRVELG